MPSPLSVPADRDAPAGILPIVMESVSEPSRSRSVESIFSAIALPSPPSALERSSVGASALALTETCMDTGSPLPDETVMSKSASLFCGGVMARPSSCDTVTVQVPSPLSVPAESVAPTGISNVRSSVESVVTINRISLSSTPATSALSRSTIAATSTAKVSISTPPSVEIAVADMLNVPLKSGGGVILRPFS